MSGRREYRYRVVDVFTRVPLEGNALAVFPDARGLDAALMQRVARELNLSETTFVLPSDRTDCAARVRIFTPTFEMVFAGHPTVGTAFVLRDEGVVPESVERFGLEEKIGRVAVRKDPEEPSRFWLTTPPLEFGRTFDGSACARALGLTPADLLDISPQRVSAGNPTLLIALRDRAVVDRAVLDPAAAIALKEGDPEPLCVFVFAPTSEGAYSRMFAPDHGVPEDPATGSSTGPLAAYMVRHGLAPAASGSRWVSEQGTKMGRRSFLHVLLRGEGGENGIEIGGDVTPVGEGVLRP
jgi:trans-2,3-dihydro-3-hydroxyanthranilate isomerase